MSRRPAYSEIRWPMDPDAVAKAQTWARGASIRILDWTWRSFEQFHAKHLSQCSLTRPLEEIERDLTSKHFVELNGLWARETKGYSSVTPIYEFPELASRPEPPGRSPAYDFAFVCNENPNVAWPIETKVVPSVRSFAKYLGDVEKFQSGIASPFVGEGGLIGYLLEGAPADFFAHLESNVGQQLQPLPEFATRPHRVSLHSRSPAPTLRLHHMVMDCGVTSRKVGDRS